MQMPHGVSQLFDRLQKCVREDDWEAFGEAFAEAIDHRDLVELGLDGEAEANKDLVRRYFEMWNTGEGLVADAVLGPRYLDHAQPAVVGPAAARALAPRFHASHPGARMVIEEILADREFVSVRNAIHKTRDGEAVVYRGMAFFRVSGGKLAEHWSSWPGKPRRFSP
jgi:predicted SnoaL-like aldol condensation-catalyzing enzyme